MPTEWAQAVDLTSKPVKIKKMIILYGIPNCDSVKKARAWLTAHQLAHEFHDFKKQGLPAHRLPLWRGAVGLDKLLNRKGTTWRQLDAALQAEADSTAGAEALMLASPSLVKRPVVEWARPDVVTVGFDADVWMSHREKLA